jgi:hypothetical protein
VGVFTWLLEFRLGLRRHDDEPNSALDTKSTKVVHRSVETKAGSYEGGTADEVGGWGIRYC